MGRKQSWSKRSRNRKGVNVPERARWNRTSIVYDTGLMFLLVVMYPSLGLALWGVVNHYIYVYPYTHACTLIWPTSDLNDVRYVLIWVTLPSLLIGNFLCWVGKGLVAKCLLPVRCQRCPKCFGDISVRSRDDETCPECGMIAPRRECVQLWCKLLRSRF